jgi:hypothetical protein
VKVSGYAHGIERPLKLITFNALDAAISSDKI